MRRLSIVPFAFGCFPLILIILNLLPDGNRSAGIGIPLGYRNTILRFPLLQSPILRYIIHYITLNRTFSSCYSPTVAQNLHYRPRYV